MSNPIQNSTVRDALQDLRVVAEEEGFRILGIVNDTSTFTLVDIGDVSGRPVGVVSLRNLSSRDSGATILKRIAATITVPLDGKADLTPVRTWLQGIGGRG